MATLTFHGAAAGVTGSAYLLQTRDATVLFECGLFQGRREEEAANRKRFPFKARDLDAVVLSHAHLDHSGRLPKLIAEGYGGAVHMTAPTCDLLDIMLKDAAYLEERDTDWENRRRRRMGKRDIKPLYTMEDAERALESFVGIGYGERHTVAEGVDIRFRDAGHILGSAIVEVFVTERGAERKLVFSGDLGNSSAALLREPETVDHADVLLLESTYGDRNHRPMQETLEEFEAIIAHAARDGGNVLIPAFAVGRSQEIIFRLGEMYHAGKLAGRRVFLDSPMAIAATEVYQRYRDSFNKEDSAAMRQAKSGSLKNFLPVLHYSRTPEDSMALNNIRSGAIIIAGSGMCNGGRIRHHFKHNLWRDNCHVIIAGFQAAGTPGRALVDGARKFRVGSENIVVKAKIHTLGGFSAHAGQSQLLDWVGGFSNRHLKTALVHGEPEAKDALRSMLAERGRHVQIPVLGSSITL
jgi:metallo-beta-lactamase family protein